MSPKEASGFIHQNSIGTDATFPISVGPEGNVSPITPETALN